MTEPLEPQPASEPGEGQQQQSDYTPPATQAELDRIISERVARTKNQFKDYPQLRAAAEELAQIKAANQTAEQRQAEELSKWQTEAQTWRKAAVSHRVEALASDFADPSDAVGALADKDYLDAGGQIDAEAIRRDLAEVLERKPHWRRAETGAASVPRVPAPNPAQGSGGGRPAADPAQEFAAILQSQLRP